MKKVKILPEVPFDPTLTTLGCFSVGNYHELDTSPDYRDHIGLGYQNALVKEKANGYVYKKFITKEYNSYSDELKAKDELLYILQNDSSELEKEYLFAYFPVISLQAKKIGFIISFPIFRWIWEFLFGRKGGIQNLIFHDDNLNSNIKKRSTLKKLKKRLTHGFKIDFYDYKEQIEKELNLYFEKFRKIGYVYKQAIPIYHYLSLKPFIEEMHRKEFDQYLLQFEKLPVKEETISDIPGFDLLTLPYKMSIFRKIINFIFRKSSEDMKNDKIIQGYAWGMAGIHQENKDRVLSVADETINNQISDESIKEILNGPYKVYIRQPRLFFGWLRRLRIYEYIPNFHLIHKK